MTNAPKPKQRRGFAAMSMDKRREIASKGGKAAHACGRAYQWTTETARIAGQKGAHVAAAAARDRRLADGATR